MRSLHSFRTIAVTIVASVLGAPAVAQQLPRPADSFGFEPGADYQLADYDQMIAYYRKLDAATDRVAMREIGRSARGKPMYLLTISSEANMRQLERWRSISERLSRARIPEAEARQIAREGRAVVWIDGGLDDQEYATGQLMPELIWRVASDDSPEMRKIRDNVVALMMPHMNPEASASDVAWYRAHKGTPFEVTEPPRLGQPYVGSDNNRDWFMITQPETWAASKVFYHEWYPQIIYNHHQTGPARTRIVIPPYSDPVNPDIHPGVTAGVNMVGAAMAARYASLHMPGYVSRVIYDMWWNGGMRLAPYYHNMIGILTETSHAFPTPIRYDTTQWPETIEARKGDVPRTDGTSIFYAYPWKAPVSRFRDAINYMREASLAVLNLAANYREETLFNAWRMGRDAIEAGERGNPFAYLLPAGQWDPSAARDLVNVFRRGGVEVQRATQPFRVGGAEYPAGTYIVPTAQAYRPLVMNLMEPQRYPDRRLYRGGPPEPPYDLSGWTLALQIGANVVRVNDRFTATAQAVGDSAPPSGEVRGTAGFGYALSRRVNASARAVNRLLAQGEQVYWAPAEFTDGGARYDAGTFVIERREGTEARLQSVAREAGVDFTALATRPGGQLRALRLPRIGLYKSWVAVDDLGWTLWLLEQYAFPVDTLHNRDIQTGDLTRYDALVFPDQAAEAILNGHAPGTMPEEYVGGLGPAGVAALDRYVRNGGTIVAFDDASDFVMEQLGLPVRNAVAGVSDQEFFIPGTLIRAQVDVNHPIAHGMQREAAAFFRRSRAFEIVRGSRTREGGRVDVPESDPPPAEVVASYARENLLMSGWAIGQDRYLAGRPAVVRVRHGSGQAVLFAFQPQFRSQPRGTYKLIF
ncbi:MAG TPA: M14 metallopeptidase family protein, partial [Gemmatimonadales bacterium]|nr:M14 metallopeptidase family protein [Gemmatimonadales bacterium]